MCKPKRTKPTLNQDYSLHPAHHKVYAGSPLVFFPDYFIVNNVFFGYDPDSTCIQISLTLLCIKIILQLQTITTLNHAGQARQKMTEYNESTKNNTKNQTHPEDLIVN